MRDVIIVGGGPAGFTAALYCKRAGLDTLLFSGFEGGGQLLAASSVKNYPGFGEISGPELSSLMRNQAVAAGCEIIDLPVAQLDLTPGALSATADGQKHDTLAIILATGSSHQRLGIPGEDKFAGMGVSYCATCDGNFFKDRVVAVAGGGGSALKDALYLANLCSKVYMLFRRAELRGSEALIAEVKASDKIELLPHTTPAAVSGGFTVEGLDVRNVESGVTLHLPIAGLFVSTGVVGQSALTEGILPLDDDGRIIAGEDCRTAIPGVFAAGDLRAKPLYQITTAVGDGAVAATAAGRFISKNKSGAR